MALLRLISFLQLHKSHNVGGMFDDEEEGDFGSDGMVGGAMMEHLE